MHNECPWAFIKVKFEQFLFPLSVLDVWCFWLFSYINLTVWQRSLHKNSYLSFRLYDFFFFFNHMEDLS